MLESLIDKPQLYLAAF